MDWYEKMKVALFKGGDFLEDIGLDYMLAGGTLLGAIRDGALIKHDSDIDVAVLAEDITDEIAEKLFLSKEFMARNSDCHFKHCHITLQYGGAHFDIFPLNEKNGKRLFNQTGDRCLVWEAHYYDKDKWETVTMYGRQWNTPKTPKKFLEVMYGKNWRIPDTEFKWEMGLNYMLFEDV